jgi:hypothetical protein
MKKIIIIILIILIAIIGVGFYYFYFKSIEVEDIVVASNEKPLKVDIVYPQILGFDDFNNKVKTIIDKEFDNFKENSLANDKAVKDTDPETYSKYPREYELNISYIKGQVDNNIISIIFQEYKFEGGAHGASNFISLNYDVKRKTEVKLSNLFLGQSNYLQKISDFCINNLKKQLIDKLGNLNGVWVEEGAGPKEENFQIFLINPDNTITFYFPQYQVAYGSAGDFKVIYQR